MVEHVAAAAWHCHQNFPSRCRFRLVAFLLLLLGLLKPGPASAIDCDTPVKSTGNSKLELAFDNATVRQTSGGEVSFTITGLDPAKDPTVVACLRWKAPPTTKQPAPKWNPLPVSRAGTTKDKTGIVFAVTIPDLGDPPANVETNPFETIPTAELRILAAEGTAVELDAMRDVGVTSKLLAAILALGSAVAIGVVLYFFAKTLGVPGRNVILRIISTGRGWASLAQFQIILWTVVIGSGAVYVMSLTSHLIVITSGTLILLGIAGGAAVGSQLHATQQAQPSTTVNPPGPVTGLGPEASSCVRAPHRGLDGEAVSPLRCAANRTGYCRIDFAVGTMRVTTIFERSRQPGTRGAITFFQWSLS